jgi:hypothetical protein
LLPFCRDRGGRQVGADLKSASTNGLANDLDAGDGRQDAAPGSAVVVSRRLNTWTKPHKNHQGQFCASGKWWIPTLETVVKLSGIFHCAFPFHDEFHTQWFSSMLHTTKK